MYGPQPDLDEKTAVACNEQISLEKSIDKNFRGGIMYMADLWALS